MAYEESEGSEDSDMEDLQTPNFPPEKPPNLVLYYIVDNRDRGLTDEELRTEFREKIGKQEKQKWKTKHKKANKRYHKLLQLYLDANPDFDENQIQQRASPRKRTSKSTRKRIRNSYGSRQQNVFINTYDDDMNEYQPQAAKKRRKSHDNINNSSSIDDLFREINSGTKRVIRDPDKFKPTDENKRQMQDLINKMREAARHDWQCNKKSEPAINTSLMLEVVVSELSKKLFYKYYLDDTDLLEAVRDWIHPLPDGSLPALKIRTECYRIIEKLQLHDLEKQSLDHYLQVSEDKSRDQNYASDVHPNLKSFSKTCMNLWGNNKETFANKKLLRKIMEKWIRTLTGTDSSYNVLLEEMRESQEDIQERYKMLQKQKRDFNFGEQKRAKIPEKPWHDFATNPSSIIDDDLNISRGISGTPHPLQDKINKTFRRNTSSKQAARPSVTGRKMRK